MGSAGIRLCGQTLVAPRGSSLTAGPQELDGTGGPTLPTGLRSPYPQTPVDNGREAGPYS